VLELTTEVRSILDFVEQEMDRMDVKIRTHFPSQSALVRFDPNRLRQVLLNLLQNAQQALQGPGEVDISISQTPARVTMRIADNGPGLPEPDRQRVFEPFYSLKKNGSGLGLALVNRYVLEAKGTVTCEGHHPRGTAFVIELPRALEITRS
jgi:two-component system nitrogen regulation sensor histidine kinase NtrY